MKHPDYSQIDFEVRLLVRLLNELPGIETVWSCAGHAKDAYQSGYVTFRARDQAAVELVVRAVGETARTLIGDWDVEWQRVRVDVAGAPDGPGLWYSLRFAGHPRRVQRALIGRLEDALSREVSRRRRSGPASSLPGETSHTTRRRATRPRTRH